MSASQRLVREETFAVGPAPGASGKRLVPPVYRGPSLRKDGGSKSLGPSLARSQSQRGQEGMAASPPSTTPSGVTIRVPSPHPKPIDAFMSPVHGMDVLGRPVSGTSARGMAASGRLSSPGTVTPHVRRPSDGRLGRTAPHSPSSPFVHFLSELEAKAAVPQSVTDTQQLVHEWLASYSLEEHAYSSAAIAAEVKLR